MVFCSSVWFYIYVVGFLKLYINFARESTHIKLKRVRTGMQKIIPTKGIRSTYSTI